MSASVLAQVPASAILPAPRAAPAAPAAPIDILREAREAAAARTLFRVEDVCREPVPLRPRCPTIGLREPGASRRTIAASRRDFLQNLQRQIACLEGFDFRRHGLVVAGGAAGAALSRQLPGPVFDDIDLFFVRPTTEEAAAAAADDIAETLHGVWRDDLAIYRKRNVITFLHERHGLSVQLVLHPSDGVADLLYAFDFGGGGVASDGEDVWISAYGRLAAENSLLLPNWGCMSAAFWLRARKYMQRGFRLALPELDVAWILGGSRMAGFEFVRPELGAGLAIVVDDIVDQRPPAQDPAAQKAGGDSEGPRGAYDEASRACAGAHHAAKITLRGLTRCAFGRYAPGRSVTELQPPRGRDELGAFLRTCLEERQSLAEHRATLESVFGAGRFSDAIPSLPILEAMLTPEVLEACDRSFPFTLDAGWAAGAPEWAIAYGRDHAREARLQAEARRA